MDKFLRKEVELKTYEEMEIWGKFTPPEQFIQYDDVDDKEAQLFERADDWKV